MTTKFETKGHKGFNSDSVRDISKIFATDVRFWGTEYWMKPIEFHRNRPLSFKCHVTPNCQDHDCKISMARYLRNRSTVAKRYFTNKTANINVQNVSSYIHLLMATFKDLHIENSKNYKRWYYSAVHWHSQCDVGNITFCNFCCFRCASP